VSESEGVCVCVGGCRLFGLPCVVCGLAALRSFVCSFVCLFVCLFVCSLVRSLFASFVAAFVAAEAVVSV